LIILDASVAIEWLLEENPKAVSFEVYDALSGRPLLVPSHWPLEIANTLRPDLRDNRISIADFHAIMERLDRLDIRVQAPLDFDEIGPLTQFAVAHKLTTYDAAYVQLALGQGATLATLDRAMRSAAMTLNIPLLPAAAP
jgi:predicted nucleic acid-binding protein